MFTRPHGAVLVRRLREPRRFLQVLALTEIQKIPAWSETVKRLWDEDTARRRCSFDAGSARASPDASK